MMSKIFLLMTQSSSPPSGVRRTKLKGVRLAKVGSLSYHLGVSEIEKE